MHVSLQWNPFLVMFQSDPAYMRIRSPSSQRQADLNSYERHTQHTMQYTSQRQNNFPHFEQDAQQRNDTGAPPVRQRLARSGSVRDTQQPDDQTSIPIRQRVVRSRSTQGRFHTLPHHRRSQIFDDERDEPEQYNQQMPRKPSSAEMHHLKQQLGDAKQRISILERKCDQQTRELLKAKAENEKHVTNIRSLNDQIRTLKQERGRSQNRLPRASSTAGQFERRSNSVRRSYPGESIYLRGRQQKKDAEPDDDRIFPQQALSDLMNKCSEEFGLIKSQLKNQEEVFQGIQRGFSLERLPMPNGQNSSDTHNEFQTNINGQRHDATMSKSNSADSISLQQKEGSKGNTVASDSSNMKPSSSVRSTLHDIHTSPTSNSQKESDQHNHNPELQELKAQLQEQQNLISEQWKLMKTKEEAIGQEKHKLDNEWKFRMDEMDIQLKDAEEKLRRERESHTKMLAKVQFEAEQNKEEMRKRMDELLQEMKSLSTKQSRAQENASTLETENTSLKGTLERLRQEMQQQKQQQIQQMKLQSQQMSQSMQQPMNHTINNQILQPSNLSSNQPQPIMSHPMSQPPMSHPMSPPPMNHPMSPPPMNHPMSPPPTVQASNHPNNCPMNHQKHRVQSPTLSRQPTIGGEWIVPSVLYEDERLAKMVNQLLNKMDTRLELSVLRSHEITSQHNGRVLIPVIGSAGVASNIQAALDKAHLGRYKNK